MSSSHFGAIRTQQRVALAACSSRSYHKLQLAATLVKSATDAHKILFFPVFYAILDPAQIPTPADLESLQPDTRASVDCARLALEVIFDIIAPVSRKYQEPDDVGPTFWSGIWPWIFFMHEYREYLGASSVFRDPLGYTRFVLFLTDIYDPRPMRDIISATPGFRALLATTWTLLPKSSEAYETCLWFLVSIIGSLPFTDPLHFAEMVDGAGACKSNSDSWLLRNFKSSFTVTLELLEHLLNTTLGYQWLPAAIEAGLLRMMAGVATEFPSMFDNRMRFLLTKILPDGLLYYHVVAAMAKVLDEVTEIWSSKKLEDTEIVDDWNSFHDLAERRVQLLDGLRSSRACDNLECGKIQDSSRCRRCSGCKTHYYCSSDCQTADWKHGGHRNHCGSPVLL
ncbi:hypothetical protein GGX14DRAFT_696949, partial [Mycena pura]